MPKIIKLSKSIDIYLLFILRAELPKKNLVNNYFESYEKWTINRKKKNCFNQTHWSKVMRYDLFVLVNAWTTPRLQLHTIGMFPNSLWMHLTLFNHCLVRGKCLLNYFFLWQWNLRYFHTNSLKRFCAIFMGMLSIWNNSIDGWKEEKKNTRTHCAYFRAKITS